MKKLLLILSLFIFGNAQSQDIALCNGKYALCAASTCKPTGKTITTNDGQTWPEVSCTCPVLEGLAIADLTGGNMKGSCAAPDSNSVWSLFAPKVFYPQEASNFVQKPKTATRATVQACPGELAAGSTNCWSMVCTYDKTINGTQTANCKCPINQIQKGTEFLTEAGQGDPKACAKHPVAAPDIFDAKIQMKSKK